MNQRKVFWYYLKQNLLWVVCAVFFYLVFVGGTLKLLGEDRINTTLYLMLIIMNIPSVGSKNKGLTSCGVFLASRKLMFRFQLCTDIVLALILGVLFTAISIITSGYSLYDGVQYGVTYFSLVLCMESIVTLDAFRTEPLFKELFSAKITKRNIPVMLAYFVIFVVFALVYSVLGEKIDMLLRLLIYMGICTVSVLCYIGARKRSLKKEF